MRHADVTEDADLVFALIRMFHASDCAHADCAQEWRVAVSLLHTLIEDGGVTTPEAAQAAALPETTVALYRAGIGI